MPELPADFDLKLMPDWLKEPATKNPYADYEGRDDDRRPGGRGGGDWGGRGRDERRGKPGGGQRPGGPPRDGGRRDDRGRKDAPGSRKPDGRRPDRPAGGGDDRRAKPGEQRRADSRGQDSRESHAPPVQPANVTIEFFPDENCALSIAKQVKSTHRAYSLFDLARMFLARPERHRLKITTRSVAEPLYQLGEDGPLWTDRASAERAAFPLVRQKYYEEVTEQREAPKGNFINVARCRANGVLLGPTSYHGYQPALRKLYEERFSRRMEFADFLREIEVVNDPALVEKWKEQVSSTSVFRLKSQEPAGKPELKPAEVVAEEPVAAETAPVDQIPPAEAANENPVNETAPVEASAQAPAEEPAPEPIPQEEAPAAYSGPVFNTLAEVEQHFRQHYLQDLIHAASSVNVSGEASRSLADRAIASAVRQAWEQERGFPGQMMHQLRQQFSRAGLHIFKHRKRMQFVSLIRPAPMENGNLSASVAEILQVIQGSNNCNRASLATAILGADENAVDPARKSSLATDFHWLIETGRVIEFSDGRLELPVAPAKTEAAKPVAEAAPAGTPAPEAPIAPATESPSEFASGAPAIPVDQLQPEESQLPSPEIPEAPENPAASAGQELEPAAPILEEAPEDNLQPIPAAISQESPSAHS